MKKIYLTQKGYQEKMKELEYLKNVKRPEIAKEIGRARELGDLSENAEYHAAKEQQAHIEKKIAELELHLSNATIIENVDMAADEAAIGATVVVQDVDSKEESTYQLVSEEEADIASGKLSITSPVGEALVGHKVSDIVKIKVPAGIITYKIKSISR
jgi:transcription elongation factor GreA